MLINVGGNELGGPGLVVWSGREGEFGLMCFEAHVKRGLGYMTAFKTAVAFMVVRKFCCVS